MGGPWEDYQMATTDKPPWEDYSPAKTVGVEPTKVPSETSKMSLAERYKQEKFAVPQISNSSPRDVLQFGGLALGGTVGGIPGAALGYGAGTQAANLLEEYTGIKQPESLGERFVGAGKDVLTGATMEAGGKALSEGIQATGKYISDSGLAERLYASSVKMPLSRKWTKVRGPEETTLIKNAVNKGIEERIPPSEYGLEKVRMGKKEAGQQIEQGVSSIPPMNTPTQTLQPLVAVKDTSTGNIFTNGANHGEIINNNKLQGLVAGNKASSGWVIEGNFYDSPKKALDAIKGFKLNDTDDILNAGLAKAVKQAKKGEAPAKELEAINNFAVEFKAGRAGRLTPMQMEETKQQLYKNINWDKMSGKGDALLVTMRKGVAHEMMTRLEQMNPALKNINKSYGDYVNLEEAVERSLARRGNRDIIDLGTKVLLGRESIPLAIINATVGHPQVKSRLSFALSRANKLTGKTISQPLAYTVGTAIGQPNEKALTTE